MVEAAGGDAPVSPGGPERGRVLISYAHDSPAHRVQVEQFAEFLRTAKIDVVIDRDAEHDPVFWPQWMAQAVREARFILVIASHAYKRRAEETDAQESALGVRYEGRLLQNMIYMDPVGARRKILPVVLLGHSPQELPDWMLPGGSRHYVVPDFTEEGAASLLRVLRRAQNMDGVVTPDLNPGDPPHPVTVPAPFEDATRASPIMSAATETRQVLAPDRQSDEATRPTAPARIGRRVRWIAPMAALLAGVLVAWLMVRPSGSRPPEVKPAPITLTISTYGETFPQSLFMKYQSQHSGVTIKQVHIPYIDYQSWLQNSINSRSAAADVAVVESPNMLALSKQTDRFFDFHKMGVKESAWTSTILGAGLADGHLVGLPADVGGLAMCYRKDLLAKAGMPTDPESITKLFASWKDYVDAGKRFMAHAPGNTRWMDSAAHLSNGILGSQPANRDDDLLTFIASSDPTVRKAWDLAADAVQAKESAGVNEDLSWQKALRDSRFATAVCPAWVIGNIRRYAPAQSGKWQVVAAPGVGGSWSGTYVTIPADGPHVVEAARFAAWLVSPDQQVATFAADHNFPSAQSAWNRLIGYRDTYFGDSLIGDLIIASLRRLPSSPVRAQSGSIAKALSGSLRDLEHGSTRSDAWKRAADDLRQAR